MGQKVEKKFKAKMDRRTRGVSCQRKRLVMVNGERHEIRTKDDRPVWTLLKEYINSLPIGRLFTRQQMLDSIYTLDVSKIDPAADYYKGWLNKLGFISTDRPAVYVKECHIPMHLTITKVKAAATDKGWQGWFIPLHERLGISEQASPKKWLVKD